MESVAICLYINLFWIGISIPVCSTSANTIISELKNSLFIQVTRHSLLHIWGTRNKKPIVQQRQRSPVCVCVCVCVLSHVQPMDCSPPSSSVHGIFQARTLEWVAISYSSGYSRRRDRTYISCISWTGRQSLYHCTKWKALRGALVWHRIVSPTFFCPWFTGFPNHCALKHSASVLLNSIGHGVFSWGLGHRINSRIY